jgi:hypothetical protein
LACWRVGVLACWRVGVLACWRVEVGIITRVTKCRGAEISEAQRCRGAEKRKGAASAEDAEGTEAQWG